MGRPKTPPPPETTERRIALLEASIALGESSFDYYPESEQRKKDYAELARLKKQLEQENGN